MVTAWNQAIEEDEATVEHSPQSLKIKLYIMYEAQSDNRGRNKKAASTEEASPASVPATPAAPAAPAAMAPLPWGVSPWSTMPAMPSPYQMPTPA